MLILDCDGALESAVATKLDSLIHRSAGNLRVVLVTREDPLLPLHRYRLAETVVELRMADLAFTVPEARELLTGTGVDLSEAGDGCRDQPDPGLGRRAADGGDVAGAPHGPRGRGARARRQHRDRRRVPAGRGARHPAGGPAPPAARDERRRRPPPGPGRCAGRPACRASPQLPGARERLPRGAARAPRLLPLPPALPRAPARPAGLRGPGPLGRAAPGRRHLAGRPRSGRGRGPARDGDRRLGDGRSLRGGRPVGAAPADGSRDRPAGRGAGADAQDGRGPGRDRRRSGPGGSRRRLARSRRRDPPGPAGDRGRRARGRQPSWPSACWSSRSPAGRATRTPRSTPRPTAPGPGPPPVAGRRWRHTPSSTP